MSTIFPEISVVTEYISPSSVITNSNNPEVCSEGNVVK